jgi:hypothetical protein
MLVAKGGSGENEHHIVAIRMRLTGAGNLKASLTDLQDVQTQNLLDIPIQAITRIEPSRLANFQSQRIRLVLTTTEIDEHFKINRIVIFAKPVAMEYPMLT